MGPGECILSCLESLDIGDTDWDDVLSLDHDQKGRIIIFIFTKTKRENIFTVSLTVCDVVCFTQVRRVMRLIQRAFPYFSPLSSAEITHNPP